jgi:CubicO group peptidase (beta-lactamase class C family)
MLDVVSLEERITERMRAGRVPGLAIAVTQGENIIYSNGFGVTSLEDGGVPVTPRTLFHIGSTTKPLTGTMIMRLVEAGVLDLDRPVGDYAPDLRFSFPSAERIITLRMLLSHTSGLQSSAISSGSRDPDGLARVMQERLVSLSFVAPPETVYFYSNDGLQLAGYIAEVTTHEPFDDLIRRLVFEPLEMTRTTYDPLVAMTYPHALSHAPKDDGSLAVEHRMADYAAGHPCGFLYSTVLDVANFAMLHLNTGRFQGQPVLTPASVALMHRPQTSLYTVYDEGYGLTFRTERYKGIRLLRHHGVFMYYSSIFYLAPDHGLGVSILFNSMAAPVGADALAKSIFDELLALPAEVTRPRSFGPQAAGTQPDWLYLTGEYLSLNAGLATIGVVDERLTLDFNGTIIPLEMYAPNIYFGYIPGSGALVSAGFVPALSETHYLLVNGSLFERFTRDPDYLPDIAILETYAGTYVGETGTLVVECEEGALVGRSPEDDAKLRFVALGPTSFVGPIGLIEFSMGETGRVTGMTRGRFYPFHRAG